jgi:hypothetical protein
MRLTHEEIGEVDVLVTIGIDVLSDQGHFMITSVH